MTATRLHPAPPVADLVALLTPALRVEPEAPSAVTVTHLDTFDWRLFQAGARLCREREGRSERWVWAPPGGEAPRSAPVTTRGRFAAELPPGWLREALAALLGPRALLDLGQVDLHRQLLRVVDADGNTAVRVWWEHAVPLGSDGRPAGPDLTTVRLEPLPEHGEALDRLVALLALAGATTEAPGDDLAVAAAARGREPGDYSSKPKLALEPDQPAAAALRAILGQLLANARANVEGAVADLDSEFLHDLRVAVRRSRSALGQLPGVLPQAEEESLAAELSWLGAATGECRDLDVFLLQLEGGELRRDGAAWAALEGLRAAVASDRARAHRELAGVLRSNRCAQLFERWGAVATASGAGPGGSGPVRPLADASIERALRRVLKRGRRLAVNPPADELHRLRIAAKKLRYLLELFRSLYPDEPIRSTVAELRRLQDLLGEVQDTVVQLHRLEALAERLLASRAASGATLLAMGRLVERITTRQGQLCADFGERFAELEGAPARRDLERLLAGREGDTPCG